MRVFLSEYSIYLWLVPLLLYVVGMLRIGWVKSAFYYLGIAGYVFTLGRYIVYETIIKQRHESIGEFVTYFYRFIIGNYFYTIPFLLSVIFALIFRFVKTIPSELRTVSAVAAGLILVMWIVPTLFGSLYVVLE